MRKVFSFSQELAFDQAYEVSHMTFRKSGGSLWIPSLRGLGDIHELIDNLRGWENLS